jgi:hypothetical protein
VPDGARYVAAAIPALASDRSFQVTLYLDDSPPAAFDITTAGAAASGLRLKPPSKTD